MTDLSGHIEKALLLLVVLAPSLGLAQQPHSSIRVLALHWYDRGYSDEIRLERELRADLESSMPGRVEFYSEYLDTNQFPGENQPLILRDYLRQKYSHVPIDVIIAIANPPLDFLLHYRRELFPHTPIVFSIGAVAQPHPIQRPGVTGIVTANSYRETVDLALRLHPKTKRLFVISGTLNHDKSRESVARTQLRGLKDAVAISYLTDLSIEELMQKLKHPPKDCIALYVWQQALNAGGGVLESLDVFSRIAPEAKLPLYGMTPLYIDAGMTGGYVWTFEGDARRLAEMALRVANGERPEDIPIENAPETPMFNWRQLQRWRIPEDRLPPGSVIKFRELTMWQQYKWRVVGAVAGFALQALLIGSLLIERHRNHRHVLALDRAQRVLAESEERFRNLADNAPVMIWVSGTDKLRTFFNRPWLSFTGQTMEQELGEGWAHGVHPEDMDRCMAIYSSSLDARHGFRMEYRLRRADGEFRWILDYGAPVYRCSEFVGYIGSCLDITEQRYAQKEAFERQKLESVGTLASGIAHDFNNLLAAVVAQAELAQAELGRGSPAEDELNAIRQLGLRGSGIVRELMIYAGQEKGAPELVDVCQVVREMLELLKISISKRARLQTDIGHDLPHVRATAAQISQVVMNLATNASDALADRDGVIRITTRLLVIGPNRSPQTEYLAQGEYIELEVSDTGCGMSAETQARVFDPFFSTKAGGRGLGLAVVQGIVRDLGGAINLVSAPGRGTTFQILLQCSGTSNVTTSERPPGAHEPTGSDQEITVLVVEDEDTLRQAVSKMLRSHGISVIEMSDGLAALEAIRGQSSPIQVLLLDITLPGASGPEVFHEALRLRPEMRVIVASAYSEEVASASLQSPIQRFIRKPYQIDDLVRAIRLDSEPLTTGHAHAHTV